jgi:hypothetical protein
MDINRVLDQLPMPQGRWSRNTEHRVAAGAIQRPASHAEGTYAPGAAFRQHTASVTCMLRVVEYDHTCASSRSHRNGHRLLTEFADGEVVKHHVKAVTAAHLHPIAKHAPQFELASRERARKERLRLA